MANAKRRRNQRTEDLRIVRSVPTVTIPDPES
jgi:hypothetical protein